jgi:preprotein translocase SecE subunit
LRVQVLPGLQRQRRLEGRRFDGTRQESREEGAGAGAPRSAKLADRTRKPNAIQRYVAETTGELRKVSWPTWPEARQLTILVIIVMIVVGIFLGVVDWAANGFLNFILGI